MSYYTKNKILIAALLLLILANIAAIAIFLSGQRLPPPMQKGPADYLVKELAFNTKQKDSFFTLVQEHRTKANSLRQQVKTAKDNFFKLLQERALTDTEKINAAKKISEASEQLDLVTFDHFRKVRAMCNQDQQKKFDSIIEEVMRVIGEPGQRNGPQESNGLPPLRGRRNFPPPPEDSEGPPAPAQ